MRQLRQVWSYITTAPDDGPCLLVTVAIRSLLRLAVVTWAVLAFVPSHIH